MKPREAYLILKKKLGTEYEIVGCKDFGSYYGFFVTQNSSRFVGNNMLTVNKSTRSIGEISIPQKVDDFLTAKNIDKAQFV
jgi:hypothetical protein